MHIQFCLYRSQIDSETVNHTRNDVVSWIEPKAVQKVITVIVKLCEDLDSGKFK